MDYGDFKGWEDGTFASTCELYRYPPRFYYYMGDVKFTYFFICLYIDWEWNL